MQTVKNILKITNIKKSYESLSVLKDVTFGVARGEKIGLVGSNGVGKSTLFKIINGDLEQDEGKIDFAKGVTIGYFPQEFPQNTSVAEYLEDKISGDFHKLGFKESDLGRPLKELSGGEKSKIALIKIINSQADIFLLDEPTNNLDIPTLILMEDFVKKSDKAFLIISHDRKFLDRTISKVIEIDEFTKKARIHAGNYSDYAKLREERIGTEWGQYRDALGRERQMNHAIDLRAKSASTYEKRFKDKRKMSKKITDKDHMGKNILSAMAGKMAKEAKVLKDRLLREKQNSAERPRSRLPLKLSFEIGERSGDKIFEIKDLKKEIGEAKIGPINLSIKYGDRILILGPNGVGKSTLIKMILGELKPDEGSIEHGSRLNIGYLPQESDFDKDNTVLRQFLEATKMEEGIGRRLLNRFNITKEDTSKKISKISPGIKSRLMLAIMMSKKVNCLILDEPSNHLDLEALENLEEAMKDFKGTLILVSHDRYFIEKIGTEKIYLLKSGEELKSLTNYQDYEESA